MKNNNKLATSQINNCKVRLASWCTFLLILLNISPAINVQAQGQSSLEVIQASYIQKFVKYTQWPDTFSFKNHFKVGVIGDSVYMNKLKYIFSHQKLKERGIILVHIDSIIKIKQVNVLFISEKTDIKLNEILDITAKKSILTISNTNGWAKKGVCINFYLVHNTNLRFEINMRSVEKAQLKIDALLLDYARIVN